MIEESRQASENHSEFSCRKERGHEERKAGCEESCVEQHAPHRQVMPCCGEQKTKAEEKRKGEPETCEEHSGGADSKAAVKLAPMREPETLRGVLITLSIRGSPEAARVAPAHEAAIRELRELFVALFPRAIADPYERLNRIA